MPTVFALITLVGTLRFADPTDYERLSGRRPREGGDPYAVTVMREMVRVDLASTTSQQSTAGGMGPGLRRNDGLQLAASSRTSVSSRMALSASIGSPKK